ncbi:MAG: hypothetical protein KatS3mg104_1031 [Phycisphaerae bacterium]|nr:MAG: hypothetical protein KatS3mg104_1031 [Phycisphaerae bacterium]
MNLLEVTKLVKTYNGRKVVDEVSFTLGQQTIVGLLGRNGAGKTTTLPHDPGNGLRLIPEQWLLIPRTSPTCPCTNVPARASDICPRKGLIFVA